MNNGRRRFLQASGALLGSATAAAYASSPPFLKLAQLILESRIAGASTENQDLDSYYVALSLYGAPARWTFDHWMKTKSTDVVDPNPMIVTKFTGSSPNINAVYETLNYKGVLVPYLWSTPGVGVSGSRPLNSLLDHMIVFRGYGTGVDGHPSNHMKQFAPIGSLGSLSGYMAEKTKALLPAVQYPAHFNTLTGYRSMIGASLTGVALATAQDNLLKSLLSPFIKRPELKSAESLRRSYGPLLAQISNGLKQNFYRSNPALETLHNDHEAALQYIEKGFEDLESSWSSLFNKYLKITNETFRAQGIPGISDQTLIASDDGVSDENKFCLYPGIRYFPANGVDLRSFVTTANCMYMAQALAFVEFVITRKLSHSMEVGILEPFNLKGLIGREELTAKSVAEEKTFGMTFDEHYLGQFSSLYLNSCLFRALSAGLLELTDQLKAAGVFERTVIHIGSDFGRAPRNTGGGSDHLFDGMVSSVITGRRTGGPLVVGNILRNGTGGVYPAAYSGTIGYKALTKVKGEMVHLTAAHVASSVAHLLGFKEIPWSNIGTPLVSFDGTNVTTTTSSDVV